MHSHARATADQVPSRPRAARDRESLVSGLAVAAVAIAAVLAAVMHTPTQDRSDAPRLALAGVGVSHARQQVALPATCAECGVVEAVEPPGLSNRPGPG